jgi:hypothetical protein
MRAKRRRSRFQLRDDFRIVARRDEIGARVIAGDDGSGLLGRDALNQFLVTSMVSTVRLTCRHYSSGHF